MSVPDYSELRNAVGAIGLAVSMLRVDDAKWLAGVAAVDQARIRSVLNALHCATAELVDRVSPDAQAIAAETARALAARAADPVQPPEPAAVEFDVSSAHVPTVLRRLELTAAVDTPPRPLLALQIESDAAVPTDPQQLRSALHAAVFGLARSRPAGRQPWTVLVSACNRTGARGEPLVAIELRCELVDKSPAAGPAGPIFGATLPPWLHECLRLSDLSGGDLRRGRDGAYELVRMTLPAFVAELEVEPAANDDPAHSPRAVA